MNKPDLTAIILAGGKSSRMGQDKGLMDFKGKPMINHVIDLVTPRSKTVFIVSNNTEYERFRLTVYPDLIPELGPIGGIYTGLTHTNSSFNLIVACDIPYLTDRLIDHLIENMDQEKITVLSNRDKIEPLIGIYPKRFLDAVNEWMGAGGRKVQDFVTEQDAKILDVSDKDFFSEESFRNINSMDDFPGR